MSNSLLAKLQANRAGATVVNGSLGPATAAPVPVAAAPVAAPAAAPAPVAAIAKPGGLMSRLRQAGAVVQGTSTVAVAMPAVQEPTPVTVAMSAMQAPVSVAPGQINPQFQPAPTAAQVAAGTAPVGTPGAEAPAKKRMKKETAAVPAVAVSPIVASTEPRKITDPPVKNIGVLYINCGPVGVAVSDASDFIVLAKSKLAEGGIADYRYVDYGKGGGMLAEATAAVIDSGTWEAIRLDLTTAEGPVVGFEFIARAGLVVR